jgi:uncharacterized protein
MPHTSSVVIVFARAPQPGRAKTRLIPLLGREGAAALHARLVEQALATANRAALTAVELHGTPAEDEFLSACASRHGAALKPQVEGDLGTRMCAALAGALEQYDRALLIGSDCPALEPEHLRRAAHVLAEGNHAVFAPTEDGGYALVGLGRCDEHVFRGIHWSTGSVMDDTRLRLRRLGWRWHELDTLWDVDRPADYARLVESGLMEAFAGAPRG